MQSQPKPCSLFFFFSTDKVILKLIQKYKNPRIVKKVLEKETKLELTLPDFMTFHKALVYKAVVL